jgi:diguanylate cyclase (GGDEF)-like protein
MFFVTSQSLLLTVCVALAAVVAGVWYLGKRNRDERRRSQEFALLAEIGSVVSSRLDPDAVLLAIYEGLQRVLDTSAFYVAFLDQENKSVHFEIEAESGEILQKRQRPITRGFTEYIIETGKPLLVKNDLERHRAAINVVKTGRPARCFCGVPIKLSGRYAGVIAVLHYERENVYNERHLEILEVAARQVAVAMENARQFTQEQKRARYLSFVNTLSRAAISLQDADEMLAAIVSQIEQTFHYDHIGVGLIDYNTKEIVMHAEAGATKEAAGKRVPLGVGIVGKVARSLETVLQQEGGQLLSVLPGAQSVLCIPISYGDTLLGVLNVESYQPSAFHQDEIMMFKTLADMLSAALHNVSVYHKVAHQSITDSLTGLKTRRFFDEALQSEHKRGLRSGRPYSVVLIDLDKFKPVNDQFGHLEGDLVLMRVARILEHKVRQSNIVARYGGDEFIVLMPETGADQASILSERLRLWIATDPTLNERGVTGSFGVAEFPLHGSTTPEIVRMADTAMYQAKRAGGNRVSIAEGRKEIAPDQQRQLIAMHLEGLLRREHFASADEILDALHRITRSVPAEKLDIAMRESVRLIVRAVEAREMHASGHGETVASYAAVLGRQLRLDEMEVQDLVFAAQVHDAGKIVVPERTLIKPGSLTFEEFQVLKSHPLVGEKIVRMVPCSDRIQLAVRHHQERFDGTGYPDAYRGDKIPLMARIICLCEAYVNMISERPYADAKPAGEAIAEIEREAGTHFDPALVRILVQQLKSTPQEPSRQTASTC